MPDPSRRQGERPNLSRIRKTGLLLTLLAGCTAGGAQSTSSRDRPMVETQCPWLTSGTAADVLGGEVASAISGNGMTEGSCRFVRRDAPMDFLEIHVSAAPLYSCPAGSTVLHGIGNEAVRCTISHEHGMAEEMASGSVRATHFTVTMSIRGSRRPAKPSDSADDPLARVADEVAGNLY